jgi:hypothetical protein
MGVRMLREARRGDQSAEVAEVDEVGTP